MRTTKAAGLEREVVSGAVIDIDRNPVPVAVRLDGAARMCGVSVRQFRRWCREGRVPKPDLEELDSRGRSRMLVWIVKDLQSWIESWRTDGGKRPPGIRLVGRRRAG